MRSAPLTSKCILDTALIKYNLTTRDKLKLFYFVYPVIILDLPVINYII